MPEAKKYLESINLPTKAILLVDNASSHGTTSTIGGTDDFKILYMAPNMTAYLQPLDQEIIKSLKSRYRLHLLSELASRTENQATALKTINLLDVVYMITQAWDEVSTRVIEHGFNHLFADQIDLNLPPSHFNDEDDIPLIELFNSLVRDDNITEAEIIEWATGGEDPHHEDFDDANIEIVESGGEVNVSRAEDLEHPITDIDAVINTFNTTIEWSHSMNLPIQEILLLRYRLEKKLYCKNSHSHSSFFFSFCFFFSTFSFQSFF